MAEKRCPYCNSVNPDGDQIHYCGMCGRPLETDENNAHVEYGVVTESQIRNLESIYTTLLPENIALRYERDRLQERVNWLQARVDKLQARVDDSSLSSKVRKWWNNKD